jgi:NitT/TauT family transport system ATP-binding protein
MSIQVRALSFQYADDPPIFERFDFEVKDRDNWAILGPSGCGKSTLLYLIAGIRHPHNGEIWVKDEKIERPRPRTGLILQDYGLLPWATVLQNATLGLRVRRFYGPDGTHAPTNERIRRIEDQAHYWLERLGLSAVANQYPGQISGGQRQRTAIARTLALNPDVLIMDEPFASLDAPTRESLQKLILQLHAEQDLTTLIVTHSIEEAVFLGRKILLLTNPPNQQAKIIANPNTGKNSYIHSADYADLCNLLRQELEHAV